MTKNKIIPLLEELQHEENFELILDDGCENTLVEDDIDLVQLEKTIRKKNIISIHLNKNQIAWTYIEKRENGKYTPRFSYIFHRDDGFRDAKEGDVYVPSNYDQRKTRFEKEKATEIAKSRWDIS